MSRFIKLEKLINLYDGYSACFEVSGTPLLLVHDNNRSHLFLNRCPHKQKPLGAHCLQINRIRCPWHGLEYDLETGQCLGNQPTLRLTKFKLDYEEQFIGVYIE